MQISEMCDNKLLKLQYITTRHNFGRYSKYFYTYINDFKEKHDFFN